MSKLYRPSRDLWTPWGEGSRLRGPDHHPRALLAQQACCCGGGGGVDVCSLPSVTVDVGNIKTYCDCASQSPSTSLYSHKVLDGSNANGVYVLGDKNEQISTEYRDGTSSLDACSFRLEFVFPGLYRDYTYNEWGGGNTQCSGDPDSESVDVSRFTSIQAIYSKVYEEFVHLSVAFEARSNVSVCLYLFQASSPGNGIKIDDPSPTVANQPCGVLPPEIRSLIDTSASLGAIGADAIITQ